MIQVSSSNIKIYIGINNFEVISPFKTFAFVKK